MKRLFFFVIISFVSPEAFSQQYTPASLAAVNSDLDEQNPVVSPDGNTLYITIANHVRNIAGKRDPGDIWISTWDKDHWSAPRHGGNVINDRNYNGVAGISPDGQQLFLFNHYETGSVPATTQGISVVKKNGGGWSSPQQIKIPYFLNRSGLISGQVSPDGTIFIYSAEAYNTRGAEDLYVALKNSTGAWEEPKNLGPVINSSFQEVSPALSADGKTIYFSSNGRKGYGSFDIYFAERLDDTWLNWSMPVNMGSKINTDGRELYYHTYPKSRVALYTSTQNSDGYGDIKVNRDSVAASLPDSLIKIIAIRRDTPLKASDKLTFIKGNVTDSKTGQPIVARLDFKSDSLRTAKSSAKGSYSLMIPSTQAYTIVVEATGYVGVLEKLDIHTFEMKQIEMNFKLQPIEVGATVNLRNVLFQVGKTNLLKESYDELDVVVDLLRSNPRIQIELAGHTDNRGDAKANLKLSQSRVDKVKSYIVSKGISGKRIVGKGYGGKKPIASSNTEENRQMNRRVEFTIIKN